ncbi:hypothetical protein [Cohnella kolymensis]|uniref:hypothetical protein n=1 Tax=Cohnella kolymensis TaxID=1590652 RepID=UPI000A567397|nr:hypothetical protein [Cohnella kolymensis]
MDLTIKDWISLIMNVGFPAVVCLILLRYVLDTMGEKIDKLESSLEQLTGKIKKSGRR